MRDVNRTREQIRLGQCERETQFFSYAECPIAPYADALFGHVPHLATKCLAAPLKMTDSINRETVELSMVRHGSHSRAHSLDTAVIAPSPSIAAHSPRAAAPKTQLPAVPVAQKWTRPAVVD